jgi:hypothetical protein
MVLTVSFVLSPVTGLFCHRRLAEIPAKLDASVGASGPHDFTVRISAIRQRRIRVHRIPSRVRDDRDTPLMWDETAGDIEVIWVNRETEYFCKWGWTGFTDLPVRHKNTLRRAIIRSGPPDDASRQVLFLFLISGSGPC